MKRVLIFYRPKIYLSHVVITLMILLRINVVVVVAVVFTLNQTLSL